MIDVLVLNYNDSVTTAGLINVIKLYSCIRKILVVDNHSTDGSFEKLSVLSGEKVLVVQTERNGGYGAGNNFGIRYLLQNFQSEHVLICNPDVAVSENTLSRLSDFLSSNKEYAIVAPAMKIPQKGFQYCAFRNASVLSFLMSVELIYSRLFSPLYLRMSSLKKNEKVDVFAVAGSLFMVDARKFAEKKLYDENMFLYFEEFVLGKNCQQDRYKTALLPKIFFIHNHSVSISKTYRSVLKKQFIYLQSYRYVLKNYFLANSFLYFASYVMSGISLMEVFVWSNLCRFYRTGRC